MKAKTYLDGLMEVLGITQAGKLVHGKYNLVLPPIGSLVHPLIWSHNLNINSNSCHA